MPHGNGLSVLQDSQNEKDIDADHSMTETVQLGVALAKTDSESGIRALSVHC